jgi:predicted dehydrogenase
MHRAKFGSLWLIDPTDLARSRAAAVVAGKEARSLRDVDDEIHSVIIAAPNQLHYPLAQEALSRGAHVLLEKPFVVWPEEGRRLIEAAQAQNRVIAVNQTRRFFALTGELRRRIDAGEFGRLRSIVHREGVRLTWPFESGAGFTRGALRTGVIMDFGVHVVDFYHYLLQPKWTVVSATHDGFQGPEGLAEIELQANDVPVSLLLSRYYPQQNVAHLAFEGADVVFNVYDTNTYAVRSRTGTAFSTAHTAAAGAAHAELLLFNFLAACEKKERAVCDAASSLPVIEILDQVYALAERYSAQVGSV